MSTESLGLWLSVAGFLLSFISAYTQIKGFFIKVFRVSSTAAKRWADKDRRTTEIFLQQPSAFAAYLASRLVLLLICLFLIVMLRPVASWASMLHPWLGAITNLIAPVLAGLILGTISANSASVSALARKNSSEG